MSQEAREHRRLIRQRGAGVRELKAASFGFSFGMVVPPLGSAAAPAAPSADVGLPARSETVEVPDLGLVDDGPELEEARPVVKKTKTTRKGTGKRIPDVQLASAPPDAPKQKPEPRKRGRPRKAEAQKAVVEEEPPQSNEKVEARDEGEDASADCGVVLKPATKRRKRATKLAHGSEPLEERHSTALAEDEQIVNAARSPVRTLQRKRDRPQAVTADDATALVSGDNASIKGVRKRKQQIAKIQVSANPHQEDLDVSTVDDTHRAAGKKPTKRTASSDHQHNATWRDRGAVSEETHAMTKQRSEVQPLPKGTKARQHRESTSVQEASEDPVNLLHQDEIDRESLPSSRTDAETLTASKPSEEPNETQRKWKTKKKNVAAISSLTQPPRNTKACSPPSIYDEESIQQPEPVSGPGKAMKGQRDEEPQTTKNTKTRTKPTQEDQGPDQCVQALNARSVLTERSLNPRSKRPAVTRIKRISDEDEDEGDLGAILKRYGAPKIPSTLTMASDPRLKFRF